MQIEEAWVHCSGGSLVMEDLGQKILSEYDVVSGFAGQDLEAPVNLLEILDPLPLPIPDLPEHCLPECLEQPPAPFYGGPPLEPPSPSWRELELLARQQRPILRPEWVCQPMQDVVPQGYLPEAAFQPSLPTAQQFRDGTAQSPFSCTSNQSEAIFQPGILRPRVHAVPSYEHESCTTVSSLSSYEPHRGHSLGSAMTRVFDRARDLYLAQQQQEEQSVSQNELLEHMMDGRIPMLSFEANEADSLSRGSRANESRSTNTMAELSSPDIMDRSRSTPVSEPDFLDRTRSTPVPEYHESGVYSPRKNNRRRSSRLNRPAGGIQSQASLPQPARMPFKITTSSSFRVVTGSGDFEFPRWKSSETRDTAKRLCIAVRTNDLRHTSSTTTLIRSPE